MSDKTLFSDLLRSPSQDAAQIPSDRKACVNCRHARAPPAVAVDVREGPATAPYVMCKRGPPSVLIMPSGRPGQLEIKNRWPAMGFDEECDAFESAPPSAEKG